MYHGEFIVYRLSVQIQYCMAMSSRCTSRDLKKDRDKVQS